MALLTKKKTGVPIDTAAAVRAFAQWALGLGDVRLDRLEGDEQREAVELIERADVSGDGGTRVDWQRLSKREKGRLEELLARAGGLPPDHFAQERRQAALRRKMAELGAEAKRLATLDRRQEADFFRVMHRQLESGHLWLPHVAWLTFVVAQFQAGKGLAPGACIEGDGDAMRLVYDGQLGMLGNCDQEGRLGSPSLVAWLTENGWLVDDARGRTRRIGLGPKTIKALRGGVTR
jgi:hypothetical protein